MLKFFYNRSTLVSVYFSLSFIYDLFLFEKDKETLFNSMNYLNTSKLNLINQKNLVFGFLNISKDDLFQKINNFIDDKNIKINEDFYIGNNFILVFRYIVNYFERVNLIQEDLLFNKFNSFKSLILNENKKEQKLDLFEKFIINKFNDNYKKYEIKKFGIWHRTFILFLDHYKSNFKKMVNNLSFIESILKRININFNSGSRKNQKTIKLHLEIELGSKREFIIKYYFHPKESGSPLVYLPQELLETLNFPFDFKLFYYDCLSFFGYGSYDKFFIKNNVLTLFSNNDYKVNSIGFSNSDSDSKLYRIFFEIENMKYSKSSFMMPSKSAKSDFWHEETVKKISDSELLENRILKNKEKYKE